MEIYVIIFIVILAVFIRRFMPAKGFLFDKYTEQITSFGEQRVVKLKNLTGYKIEDLVNTEPVVNVNMNTNNVTTDTSNARNSNEDIEVKDTDEGVELADISNKSTEEVDVDYMYANLDASEESLSETMKKGGL